MTLACSTAAHRRRWLAAIGCALLSWLAPAAAAAADRIAVVISTANAKDLPLAENLTEVAIARLAEAHAGELVGTRELSRLLSRTREGKAVATCVSEAACLAHLREELAIALVVEGKLRREGAQITLDLQLLDADRGEQRRHVSRASAPAVDALVLATRASVDELFAPIPEAKLDELPEARVAEPVVTLPTRGVVAAPGPAPILAPLPEPPPTTGSLRTAAAYGTGALAVLSATAAVLFGARAQRGPSAGERMHGWPGLPVLQRVRAGASPRRVPNPLCRGSLRAARRYPHGLHRRPRTGRLQSHRLRPSLQQRRRLLQRTEVSRGGARPSELARLQPAAVHARMHER